MIVGFQGRKRSGKNEAAHRLAQIAAPLGWDVEFRAFADPLKDTVCAMYGITRAELEELKEANGSVLNFPVRTLLQNFGEAARRYFGHDLWLDMTAPLSLVVPEGKLLLITDVRPGYEVERVQELGGVVVRLEGGDPFDGHSTEVMGGDPDYFIDNSAHSACLLDSEVNRLWWWLACGTPRLDDAPQKKGGPEAALSFS